MRNRNKCRAAIALVIGLLVVSVVLPTTAQAKDFPYTAITEQVNYLDPYATPYNVRITPFILRTNANSVQILPQYITDSSRQDIQNEKGVEISYRLFDMLSPLETIKMGYTPEQVWVPEQPPIGYYPGVPAHWETQYTYKVQ